MTVRASIPEFANGVSRRALIPSPLMWRTVLTTFAAFSIACVVISSLDLGYDRVRVLILAGLLGAIAVGVMCSRPPQPDERRLHLFLSLTYLMPMASMFAFAPHSSGVAITMAFAGPLASVWMSDHKHLLAHMFAATVALMLPSALGATDLATFVACVNITASMWALCFTCILAFEAAEAQGRELQHLGRRDPLTGIGNRRLLEEELERELERYASVGTRCSILTFDLNGFKALNDTVGHAAGDELLRATAEVLERCTRDSDTVVRQGGDEFCIVLPGASPEDAASLGQLIRTRLQSVEAYGAGIETGVGVASCPQDGTDADALLAAADHRLLADKALGPKRDAVPWNADRAQTLPRLGFPSSPGSSTERTPSWTITGVSRHQMAALPASWNSAIASTTLTSVVILCILLFAPSLARPTLAPLLAVPVVITLLLAFSRPPAIGTVRNHAYISLPYVLPALYALSTRPGAIALAMAMIVGPLAAVRLTDRRQIAAHLVVATIVFLGVLAARVSETETVLAVGTVIAAIWALGYSCVNVLEVTEEQGRKLARLVRRDPLTELGNRRRLRERLEEELARGAADATPVTLVVLDLNGFKALNDTLGHAAGDELLREVGVALREIAVTPAEAMRQGGDEFAVVLPGVTMAEAAPIAAAISQRLGSIDAHGVAIATGLGMASFPADGNDVDGLLDRADHRLRSDKYGDRPAGATNTPLPPVGPAITASTLAPGASPARPR